MTDNDATYKLMYTATFERDLNQFPLDIINPVEGKRQDELIAWMMGVVDAVGDLGYDVEGFLYDLENRMLAEYRKWWDEWQAATM